MTFIEQLSSIWQQMVVALDEFTFSDFLDICLVAFILYHAIKLIRETRAVQLAKGLLVVGIVYIIISALRMSASEYIFRTLFTDFILVLIILFQPEIRHAIESMGRTNLRLSGLFGGRDEQQRYLNELRDMAIAVSKACTYMSARRIGALIVFEKETLLGDVIKSGTVLDAAVTPELISNIFFPKSPLHDGAVIMRGSRIYAAGCVLPLSEETDLSSELGTRHRAAMGMSAQSDAFIVVISEETGNISVAVKGELRRGLSEATLREELITYFSQPSGIEAGRERVSKIKTLFRRRK